MFLFVSFSFSVFLMFLCPRPLDLLASLSLLSLFPLTFFYLFVFLSFCLPTITPFVVKCTLECYLIKITSYSDLPSTIVNCRMFVISGKEELARYICTICPDDREMPGFEGVVAKWDRNKHGE